MGVFLTTAQGQLQTVLASYGDGDGSGPEIALTENAA
jgi:hypothetical protein